MTRPSKPPTESVKITGTILENVRRLAQIERHDIKVMLEILVEEALFMRRHAKLFAALKREQERRTRGKKSNPDETRAD